jgi:hypothetical protein
MHGDFWMIVRAKPLRAFDADSPITQRCTLCGAGDNSNVLRHDPKSTAEQIAISGNANWNG